MKIRYEQPRTVTKTANPPDPTTSTEGQALDTARAEFRTAWQAKQDRANRLRARAEKAQRVETWSARISALAILLAGCVMLGCLVAGGDPRTAIWGVARTARYPWLASGVILCIASVARILLNRHAERLEAADVRYP